MIKKESWSQRKRAEELYNEFFDLRHKISETEQELSNLRMALINVENRLFKRVKQNDNHP